jgi:hypothetical protein
MGMADSGLSVWFVGRIADDKDDTQNKLRLQLIPV